MKKEESQALYWYEKAATKHNFTDSISGYGLLVLNNDITDKFSKAYQLLTKCMKLEKNDYCAYTIGMYILTLGRYQTITKVNKQ